mgnify:CR=1 FL=1
MPSKSILLRYVILLLLPLFTFYSSVFIPAYADWTLDLTPPTTTITGSGCTGGGSSYTCPNNTSITISCNDGTGSGCASIRYCSNYGGVVNCITTTNPPSNAVSVDTGTATSITALSTDNAGNQSPTVTVTAPFDYFLSNSGDVSLAQGYAGTNTIYANFNSGTTQRVDLSAPAQGFGISVSFNPTFCNPDCSSGTIINTLLSTPPGTYPITVTGSPLNKQTTFNLKVTSPALSVTCSVNRTSQTVNQPVVWEANASGGSGTYTYAWSGTDSLSGGASGTNSTTDSVTKSYSLSGVKTGGIRVVSGAQDTGVVPCSNSITIIDSSNLPWINTTSGDVHANDYISTPGGP